MLACREVFARIGKESMHNGFIYFFLKLEIMLLLVSVQNKAKPAFSPHPLNKQTKKS